ncbi:response regulator transcription factor [Georgenia subflava]|nr:response regulator transcription factor [Georgenia subflava]
MPDIVLVDDHPVVRLGVRAVLSGHPDLAVVAESTTVAQAVHDVAVRRPRLVVLDVVLGGRPVGPALCRTIKDEAAPAVLVLTARTAPAEVTAMYLAGADSLVHRTSPPATLLATVRATIEGRRVWAPAHHEIGPPPGDGHHDPAEQLAPEHLTPREREVLGLLLQHCPNADIAAALHLGLPTVKTHVRAVLRKLGLARRQDLFRNHAA